MKRVVSISVLLQTATVLMTGVLVAVLAFYALQATRTEREARHVPVIVDISNDLFSAIQNVRIERAMVDSSLRMPEPIDSVAQKEIAATRIQFATALERTLKKVAGAGVDDTGPRISEIRSAIAAYADTRRKIDADLLLPGDQRPMGAATEWLASNASVVRAIDGLSRQLENELSQTDSFIANMMQIKQMTWIVRSDSGDDRLLLREAVQSGQLSEEQRYQFAVLAGRIEGNWKLVQERARLASTPPKLRDAIDAVDRVYFSSYIPVRNRIIESLAKGDPAQASQSELQKFTTAGQQRIFAVAAAAFDLSRAHAAAELDAAQWNFYAATLLMAVFSAVGLITIIYVTTGVIRPITKITETMRLVAEGDLECAIPFEGRGDEIGSLARALRVFRDNAIEKKQLYTAKEGAEAANRAKSSFLANMSHELRTPLNAIIGFSEIIMRELFGAVNPRYRGYAVDIFDSGTHLLGLINEILDMSKLEAGHVELREEHIDVGVAIQDCMRLVERQAEQSRVRLFTSLSGGIPMVRADTRRVRQILLNLLSNAVKFTPEGGAVRVSSFCDSTGLAIAVKDTGIGMAPEDIPKALESFGQIDSILSRQYEGSGLGLPLAQRLINLHGGTLTIESKLGIGTTVTVLFPPGTRRSDGIPGQFIRTDIDQPKRLVTSRSVVHAESDRSAELLAGDAGLPVLALLAIQYGDSVSLFARRIRGPGV